MTNSSSLATWGCLAECEAGLVGTRPFPGWRGRAILRALAQAVFGGPGLRGCHGARFLHCRHVGSSQAWRAILRALAQAVFGAPGLWGCHRARFLHCRQYVPRKHILRALAQAVLDAPASGGVMERDFCIADMHVPRRGTYMWTCLAEVGACPQYRNRAS